MRSNPDDHFLIVGHWATYLTTPPCLTFFVRGDLIQELSNASKELLSIKYSGAWYMELSVNFSDNDY